MADTFEYCIAMAQSDRVTFVNHQWIGSMPMNPDTSAESLASCPWIWDWLNAMGADGWELTAVVLTSPEHKAANVFMKRAR